VQTPQQQADIYFRFVTGQRAGGYADLLVIGESQCLFAGRQPQKLPAPFRGESVPACNARFICLRDSDIHVDRFVRFRRTHGRRWQCRRARFHRILMFFSRPQAPDNVHSRVGIRTAIQCVVLCVQCVVEPFCRAHQCMHCWTETRNGPQTCKSVSPMAGS